MIGKRRLLAGLEEIIYVEEGMITMLANFSKVLVDEVKEIDEEKKKYLKKLLTRLYSDSTRHKNTIDELILKVEASDKNEY